MKALVIVVLTLSLSGCGLSQSLIDDIMLIAPAMCSETSGKAIEKSIAEVMKIIPDGTSKDEAMQNIAYAKTLGLPAVCNTLKALEAYYKAKKAKQDAAPPA